MKKLIGICFISLAIGVSAGDVEDIDYINKLYQRKYYKETVAELEIFLKKYPQSKLYDSAQNLLGYNYYILEDYDKSKAVYEKLVITKYKNTAYYYLSSIAIKQDDKIGAELYFNKVPSDSKLKSRITYELGKYYEDKEKYDEARTLYGNLLKFQDKYYDIGLLRLGILNYKLKEDIKAMAYLDEYVVIADKEDKNLPYTYFVLGKLKTKMGDLKTAEEYYRSVILGYPESTYYSYSAFEMVKLAYQQDDMAKAKSYIKLIEDKDTLGEAYLILGDMSYTLGNYDQAEEDYRQSIQNKKTEQAFYKLSLVYISQENYDKALESLEELKEGSYHNEYYLYKISILYNQKRYTDILAIEKEIDGLELSDKQQEEIYSRMSDAAYLADNFEIGYKYYEKLYIKFGNEEYLYKLMLLCIKFDKEEKVDMLFSWYNQNFKDSGDYKSKVYENTGAYYFSINRNTKSAHVYKEYLKTGESKIMEKNLINVLLSMKDYDEALKYLAKMQQTQENLYYQGIAYMGKNDYRSAIRVYEKVTDAESEWQEKAYLKLIDALMLNEDYENAIKYMDKYIAKGFEADNTKMMDSKAIAYFKLKDYAAALAIYEEMSKVEGKEAYAYFMMGEINYNSQDYAKSEENYEIVVNKYRDSKYRELSLFWLIKLNYQIQEETNLTESYIKLFVDQYPDSEYLGDALSVLGYIYLTKDDTATAVKEFEKVYGISADENTRQDVAHKIVEIYFNSEKYDEVLIWSEKLTNIGEKTYWKARSLEMLGKEEEAVAEYVKLLEIDEMKENGNYFLGDYYLRKNNLEESKKYFLEVANMRRGKYKDRALFGLGLIAEKENRYEDAILRFTKINILYANSDVAELSAIKAAENKEKLNRNTEALEDYYQFYEKHKNSEYYPVIVERLLVGYWNKDRKTEAKKFYEELKKVDAERAKLYEKDLAGGEEVVKNEENTETN